MEALNKCVKFCVKIPNCFWGIGKIIKGAAFLSGHPVHLSVQSEYECNSTNEFHLLCDIRRPKCNVHRPTRKFDFRPLHCRCHYKVTPRKLLTHEHLWRAFTSSYNEVNIMRSRRQYIQHCDRFQPSSNYSRNLQYNDCQQTLRMWHSRNVRSIPCRHALIFFYFVWTAPQWYLI